MAIKIGENIQREWDEEPFPGELWDGLEALKNDRETGITMLNDLAERGSRLAMMYLGHAYVKSGDQNQMALGEALLVRAAERGSIEGRYQLAVHHERQGDGQRAVSELKTLAREGYSPAMYLLGSILYRGKLVEQDVPEAMHYLKMAKEAGHIPATGLLSWIYRKENFGLAGKIASHWHCLAKIPPLVWYVARYPSTDRLRGISLPSANQQAR